MDTLIKIYVDGGVWMHPITFMSIVGMAVALDRFYFFYLKYNVDANVLMNRISSLILDRKIDEAIKVCNTLPNSALAQVLKAGLTKATAAPESVSSSLEEAALAITPQVTKRSTLLQQVANIATLLGLLGTIAGLIGAFGALATVTDPEQQTKLLTNGIAVAMNTTAFGLVVAIPCLLAHAMLSTLTKKILDDIELNSVKLQNLLLLARQ